MTIEINPKQGASVPENKELKVPQDFQVAPGRERLVTAELKGDEPLGDQPVGVSHETEYED